VTRRGWLLFVTLGVIWGIPYLLIKVAVRELTPATLVFLRTSIGALLLLPLAVRGGQLRALLPRWRAVVLFTVVEVALPWLLLSDAERRLSSSLSGLLVAAVPLVGAALAWMSGGEERLDARRIGGLVVGLAGVAALLGFDVGGGDLGSVAEVGIVVVGYATGPLIIARRLADLPSLAVVTASLVLCAVGYAPVALIQLPAVVPPVPVIAAVVILGVVCTALAFVVFFRLIAEVGPVRATVITYVNPAVAVALGVALLGEPLTPGTTVGFALILIGSFLATRPVRLGAGGEGGAPAIAGRSGARARGSPEPCRGDGAAPPLTPTD
jgi:drug/metabolite transporter (DMT)-like permease